MNADAADVSWIEAGFDERKSGKWAIGNMIPAGYSRYLRVMHPAQRFTGEDMGEVSWRHVAALIGQTVTALSRFEDLLPPHDTGVGIPDGENLGSASAPASLTFSARAPGRRQWPGDRKWIVVTTADSHSTLVGCGRETARELRADPAIEAWPIARDDSVFGL